MPGYTIKNIMDLEDSAAGRAPGIEARFARRQIDSEHLGLKYMQYVPQTRSPMGHSHREQEEIYLVLSGSGRMKLDDDLIDLRQWDAVRVAPTTVRAFESGPDGIEVIAIGNDRPEEGDGIIAPADWWSG